MPAPRYEDSEKNLIEHMRSTEGSGSRKFDIAKAILEIKHNEKIAAQTKQLNVATWVLAFATIGLFFATVVLVFVTLR